MSSFVSIVFLCVLFNNLIPLSKERHWNFHEFIMNNLQTLIIILFYHCICLVSLVPLRTNAWILDCFVCLVGFNPCKSTIHSEHKDTWWVIILSIQGHVTLLSCLSPVGDVFAHDLLKFVKCSKAIRLHF